MGELKKRVTTLAESHPESFQRTIGAWSADGGVGTNGEKKEGEDDAQEGEYKEKQ